MSLAEVRRALHQWQAEDELAQAPGFCRRSASIMQKIALDADVTPPHVTIDFMTWPAPTHDKNVHYALRVSAGDEIVIFNPVATALFPQYNGSLNTAPGRLREMKPTPTII